MKKSFQGVTEDLALNTTSVKFNDRYNSCGRL